MLFNSLEFAIFLPVVFILYWFVANKNLKVQNFLIVVASYIFYGWWDWRFLSLIFFSTLVDYTIGLQIYKQNNKKRQKLFLLVSVFVNLGLLGFFKYYNFFLENFVDAFRFLGHPINPQGLNIVLPVGISFYTFQTMSYTIDVYRKKIEPTRDFIAFAAFVSFFPQLVAGPIERASNLLPQFHKKRNFDYESAKEGVHQMVWGLLKKIVIADNIAKYVDVIFSDYESQSSIVLLLGIFYFSTQIYADFSGYSDIAIGVSKLFGFNLMTNFTMPNFSRDVAEYWRRWHISLSTWFRDYLYIPLGGSRTGRWGVFRNVMIIFVVSGFWHGANWTFIFWGAFNGLLFLPLILAKKNRKYLDVVAAGRFMPSFKEIYMVIQTFILISLTRVFFRSPDLYTSFNYFKGIFDFHGGGFRLNQIERYVFEIIPLIVFFYLWEWFRREKYTVINTKFELLLAIIIIIMV
ncbi:MAG: MBOAT family protein, partial [Chlorobi bacterium]|nr:MBOAT family protein [Chlorobiota bacterium]